MFAHAVSLSERDPPILLASAAPFLIYRDNPFIIYSDHAHWVVIPLVAAALGRGLEPDVSRELVRTLALGIRSPRVILSPADGRVVIVADDDGTVLGVAASTGSEVFRLPGDGYPAALAWSAARRQVAVGRSEVLLVGLPGRDGEAVAPVAPIGSLAGGSGVVARVGALAFDPEGERLAVATVDGQVSVWDPDQGRMLVALARDGAAVSTLRFSRDGRFLRAIDEAGRIQAWDTRTGVTVACPHAVSCRNGATAVDAGGARLAVASERLLVHSLCAGRTAGDELRRDFLSTLGLTWQNLAFHPCPAADRLAFGPEGHRLAAVVKDRVEIWDVPGRQMLATLRGHWGEIQAAGFAEDGSVLVTASGVDRTIRVWNVGGL